MCKVALRCVSSRDSRFRIYLREQVPVIATYLDYDSVFIPIVAIKANSFAFQSSAGRLLQSVVSIF